MTDASDQLNFEYCICQAAIMAYPLLVQPALGVAILCKPAMQVFDFHSTKSDQKSGIQRGCLVQSHARRPLRTLMPDFHVDAWQLS